MYKTTQNRFCHCVIVSLLFLVGLTVLGAKAASPPQTLLPLQITDYWNAPVQIEKVLVGEQELSPHALLERSDDWIRQLQVIGLNRNAKTIAYVNYALDFKFADEKVPRLRYTFSAGRKFLNAFQGEDERVLGLAAGQRIQAEARKPWDAQSGVRAQIKKNQSQLSAVELFVESVGFEDGTMWMLGSWLKRDNKNPDLFVRMKE
jgi:hypothetical protein